MIATHVKNIRSKLAAVKLSPIETVWGWVINGSKKLRSIFMRYIFTVAGGILFIIAINVGLYMLFCINTEVIIPAMNIEDRIADAAEKYRQINYFDTADIPSFCDYGVYSPHRCVPVRFFIRRYRQHLLGESYYKRKEYNSPIPCSDC